MFSINDGRSGGGSGGNDDMAGATKLRDTALRLGNILVWHARHTPVSAWKAGKHSDLPWPGGLLHALYDNRPKRPATPAEMARICNLLRRQRGYTPSPERLAEYCEDPDWQIFELANDLGDEPGVL